MPKEGETRVQGSERNAQELIASDASSDDIRSKGGFDLVLECTGAEPCVQMGLFAAKKRSRFVQIGMGASPLSLPVHRIGIYVSAAMRNSHLALTSDQLCTTFPQLLDYQEIEMVGSFRYGAGVYRTVIDLVATGKIDVSRIVTHRYAFKDAILAFEATKKGKGEGELAGPIRQSAGISSL